MLEPRSSNLEPRGSKLEARSSKLQEASQGRLGLVGLRVAPAEARWGCSGGLLRPAGTTFV
eukprot:3904008-Pyramimonas_sp.AAC.1